MGSQYHRQFSFLILFYKDIFISLFCISCWGCVFGWFESSPRQVMKVWVCKFAYAPFYSLTHLAILLNFWWLDHPQIVRPSPCHRLDRLLPRIVQKHPASHFKLHCLQADQWTFLLVNSKVWPDNHPETYSPQKLCKGCRPCPLH